LHQRKWTSVLALTCDLFLLCTISGKSRECVNSPGSIRFRNIIDSYVEQYADAVSKVDKMAITKVIYLKVSETSRFLKFDDKEKAWVEISSMAARDKVSHALRFASRETRRARQTHPTRSSSRSSESSVDSDTQDNGSSETTSLAGHFVHSSRLRPCNFAESLPLPIDPVSNECSEINQIPTCDTTVRDTLLLIQETQALMAAARNNNEGWQYSGRRSDAKKELQPDANIRGLKGGDLMSLMRDPIGEWQDDAEGRGSDRLLGGGG
jgi:hypothetical protein